METTQPTPEPDPDRFIQSPTGADFGALVKQMIINGPDRVSPPLNFPVHDFGQVRELVRCMIVYFPNADTSQLLKIPSRPGGPEANGKSIIQLVKWGSYEAAHRTLRFHADLGPHPKPPPGVDLGALVKQMIVDGPDRVPRPAGLPVYDFGQVRELIRVMICCFYDSDTSQLLKIPWQAGSFRIGGYSMMHFVERGEYESAYWTFGISEMIL
ncbi:MAG: hypothetical protein OXQ32_06780 [bacterium]|nr:hypothetical protein [bacterium]